MCERSSPGQVLLDEVGHAVLNPVVEDGDDVPVLEVAGDLGLAEEALADLLVFRGAGLDRDPAFDEGVAPFEDDAEATLADLPYDLVLADLLHLAPGDGLEAILTVVGGHRDQ